MLRSQETSLVAVRRRLSWALAGHVLRLSGLLGLRPVGHADGRVGGGESSAPAGMARCPAELALGLGVRGAAGLGPNDDRRFSADQSREPGREAARRFRAERI